MTSLRILILAVVVALGTVLLGWWAVPLVAAGHGLAFPRAARPGLTAALAAALAWGGYLAVTTLGGSSVAAFGAALARSLQLPGWGLLAATLAFPALLAGPASYLGARLRGRYLSPHDYHRPVQHR
jgi:hypothetical protein